ncbi:aldehyde ferredoxin oxidoreductase family protein [Hyperthermus butylicus]|uniref:Aldehyde ferredoxin oxidoreductase n=1 Tax=Hyperthermus butylicus (strain DSM 5456 / JCM 9403 / PLM1-5) TaxID=415426 RepID=A2BKT0_HYPBU|nr:aldehyde ferredoxin oxidoreductase family protein [Hyperthermus butylicus]ABM80591.1 Aldehyde ferredoxin oxidoreductase [Hyperthermus butylicus DSM 5456]
MLKGYAGRVGFVDLSAGRTWIEPLDERVAELFIGGKGFLYYYGFRLIPPSADPLDPNANVLVVAPGALAGHAPAASKIGFLAKSPLTGILCDTYAGQVFASKLKLAGFDALVVLGASDEPVYIYVENGRIEIREAGHLWGSSTWDTFQAIRKETRSGASVAAIGPAGERLVRFANIMVDGFRAAGRCGLGAVMGAKKLKAIAVWGGRPPERADPSAWRETYISIYRRVREDEPTRLWARCGTNDGVMSCARLSMCPGWHWRRPWLPQEEAEKLSCSEVLKREAPKSLYREHAGYLWGWGCPVKCSKLIVVGRKGLEHIAVKPEYENLAMLGLAAGILDVDSVAYLEWLVNSLGMDSISFGETVSWLMELYEDGLVAREDLAGLGREPRFGDPEAVAELAKLIAERRGIGAVLAEGVEKAARILGRGADRALHVKGLEPAAWDPRGRRGLVVSYATADVGASHLRGWPRPHEPPSKGPARETVESMIRDRDWKALLDSLGLCSFVPYTREEVEKIYRAVTGRDAKADELVLVGWRAEALARIHAALAGRVPEGDRPPKRWMEPIPEGPLKGVKAALDWDDLREALREFYRLRGYHEEYGVPLPETLQKLGLEWAIPEAEKALEEAKRRLHHG